MFPNKYYYSVKSTNEILVVWYIFAKELAKVSIYFFQIQFWVWKARGKYKTFQNRKNCWYYLRCCCFCIGVGVEVRYGCMIQLKKKSKERKVNMWAFWLVFESRFCSQLPHYNLWILYLCWLRDEYTVCTYLGKGFLVFFLILILQNQYNHHGLIWYSIWIRSFCTTT